MLKSYLLTLYRSVSRHQLFAALNVFGLAVGMAVFLVLMIAVRFERSFDRAASAASGCCFDWIAATSFFCAGRMRIQTLAVMIVPNIAPTWIYAARPLRRCVKP